MQRIKAMFDDDSAVSPVIGVILMVAITVILAAVIASFVLGLGDQGEPAPTPTVESSISSDEAEFSVTGGDDFDASVATLTFEVDGESIEFPLNAVDGSDNTIIEEVTAGDTITIDTDDTNGEVQINGNTVASSEITTSGGIADTTELADPANNEWEVQIVWNPSDQDSSIIYSDGSS